MDLATGSIDFKEEKPGEKTIGGHHELCDVLQPAPDGGPSQKPCNCRKWMNAPECTGVSASWCPVHGDCTCDKASEEVDGNETEPDRDCPLHGPNSSHATMTGGT